MHDTDSCGCCACKVVTGVFAYIVAVVIALFCAMLAAAAACTDNSKYKCSGCGASVSSGSTTCPTCHARFV